MTKSLPAQSLEANHAPRLRADAVSLRDLIAHLTRGAHTLTRIDRGRRTFASRPCLIHERVVQLSALRAAANLELHDLERVVDRLDVL